MLKRKKVVLLSLLVLIIGGMFMFGKKEVSFDVGEKVEGFVLKEKQKVNSAIGGTGYLFEHEKTKGQVLYVKNDDKHKAFSIFFKAPTVDSTGVSHIMEHSVLAGSQKYRGKDPFFEYFQTSPHLFMNALTWQNIVWYPFSTLYDQNFLDLMDIYLDSVFHPLLKKETFMREGWRYNFDKNENLAVNGIVYNEMKEAYASVERQLYMSGLKSLFGEYNCSGGNPENISDLSYEDFKNYHKTNYNPSNSIAYFYGDGDIEKHLKKLNSVYQNYDEKKQSEVKFKKAKGKDVYSTYSSAKGEKKSHILFSYSLGKSNDFVTEEKANSLNYLLAGYEDAPLKKAIVQSGLANDISSDIFGIQGHLIMMVHVEGIDKKNIEKIKSVYQKTLKKIVEKGFSKQAVKATISTAKFKLSHRSQNEGLDLSDEVFRSFLQKDSYFKFLNKNKIFEQYKKDLEKPNAFENLVQNLMIDNKVGYVLLKPDSDWVKKEEKKLVSKLKKLQKSFSKDELKKIKNDLAEFKESEKKPEKSTPLPNMKSSSMPKELEEISTKIAKINDVEIFYHDLVSEGENEVLRTYFDLTTVSKNLIPYVGLYANIADKFSPKGETLADFTFEQKINLGRVLHFWDDEGLTFDTNGFSANVGIGGEILSESIHASLETIEKILFKTDFSDKEKMKLILKRLLDEKEMFYRQNGRPLLRNVNQMRSFKDEFSGFGFYKFLKNSVENFDEEHENILLNFEKIRKEVFTSSALTVSIVAPEKSYDKLLENISSFSENLPVGNKDASVIAYSTSLENEAVIVPKRTQANQIIMQAFEDKNMEDFANWGMIANVLRGEFLLPEIRFKNGAYGTGASVNPNGQLVLMSRADPRLAGTYEDFDKIPNAFNKIKIPESRLDGYKLKVLASFFAPETPSQKALRVAKRHFIHLSLEDRQKWYDATRNFSNNDIKPYLDRLQQLLENKTRATQGSKAQIEKNKDLFDTIYEGISGN